MLRSQHRIHLASGFSLLVLVATPNLASVIYVDADATGAASGTSWTDAFPLLLDALAHATSGDQVWVAEGVYKPAGPGGDRARSFNIPPGVAVYGGFAGTETLVTQADPALHATVLSGDLNGDDGADFASIADNTHHVVVMKDPTSGTRLDGFTVRGGYPGTVVPIDGAGIRITSAGLVGTCVIARCAITSNRAGDGTVASPYGGGSGGGIYTSGCTVQIDGCVFDGNRAGDGITFGPGTGGAGGGLHAGPVSSVLISGCELANNKSGVGPNCKIGGGALSAVQGAALTLVDCSLHGNSTQTPDPLTGGSYAGYGGAICSSGPLVAMDCEFIANKAADWGSENGRAGSGGAIYMTSLLGTIPVTIERCTFSENHAGHASGHAIESGRGGAVLFDGFSATFDDCTFTANTAGNAPQSGATQEVPGGSGGAVAIEGTSGAFTLRGCTFEDNVAGKGGVGWGLGTTASVGGHGGAIAVLGEETSINIRQCRFDSNIASNGGVSSAGISSKGGPGGQGGAIYCVNGKGTSIVNSLFTSNRAGNSGGGSGVTSAGHGGAISSGANTTITNCTFTKNSPGTVGAPLGTGNAIYRASGALKVSNSIAWQNSGPAGSVPISGVATVQYSDVEGGFVGSGNINVNPKFVAAPNDLRLSAGSPCIDAGNDALVPLDVRIDLAGDSRFVDDPATADTGFGTPPVVDMGAYEFQVGGCAEDLDRDGDVDQSDLGLMLSAYGSTAGGDIDGDGDTDQSDLGALLATYGADCR